MNKAMSTKAKIKDAILLVMKAWAKLGRPEFDAMWNGYTSLQDELSYAEITPSLREIKAAMKELSKEGKVKMVQLYSSAGKMAGSGWILEEYKED